MVNSIYIPIAVIVLIVYIFSTAFFTGWLAGEKGYGTVAWGVLGFFFGLVALLTIGFAPNLIKSEQSNIKYYVKKEEKKWKCPKCNNENPNSTYQCENCGYKLV